MRAMSSFLKHVVAYCIVFLSIMHIAAFVLEVVGFDVTRELYYTDVVFGGELLMTCLVKIFDKKAPPPNVNLPEK